MRKLSRLCAAQLNRTKRRRFIMNQRERREEKKNHQIVWWIFHWNSVWCGSVLRFWSIRFAMQCSNDHEWAENSAIMLTAKRSEHVRKKKWPTSSAQRMMCLMEWLQQQYVCCQPVVCVEKFDGTNKVCNKSNIQNTLVNASSHAMHRASLPIWKMFATRMAVARKIISHNGSGEREH